MRHLGRWKTSDVVGLRATPIEKFDRSGFPTRDAAPPQKVVVRLAPTATRGLWRGQDANGRRVQARRVGADVEVSIEGAGALWSGLPRPEKPMREPWETQTGSGLSGEAAVGKRSEMMGVAPTGGRAVDLQTIRLADGEGPIAQHARLNAYQAYVDEFYAAKS